MNASELAFALRDVNGMGIGYVRSIAVHAAVMLEHQESHIFKLHIENEYLKKDIEALRKAQEK